MSTYCIGDIQGCYNELQNLLRVINFDIKNDSLWFVGDFVNRGPDSLKTLRFVKQLPPKNTAIVLGNHDLHLLALYNKAINFSSSMIEQFLTAEDGLDLINWLRQQPLIHYDRKLNYALTHAGIYPFWDLEEAMKYAKEVENILKSDNYFELLANMYNDDPDTWSDKLKGWERLRFIINSFTRMRFVDIDGRLDFTCLGTIGSQPQGYMPWFSVPNRKNKDLRIIFGHWAALRGKTNTPNVFALDTGCVWGGQLTAMRLEDQKLFNVSTQNI